MPRSEPAREGSLAAIESLLGEIASLTPPRGYGSMYNVKIDDFEPGRRLLGLGREGQARAAIAILPRLAEAAERMRAYRENPNVGRVLHSDEAWCAMDAAHAFQQLALRALLKRKLPFDAADVLALIEHGLTYTRFNVYTFPIGGVVSAVENLAAAGPLADPLNDAIRRFLAILRGVSYEREVLKSTTKLEALAGEAPASPLSPLDPWASAALDDVAAMPEAERSAWTPLFAHAATANGAKPGAKWLDKAATLLPRGDGSPRFAERLARWFHHAPNSPPVGASWNVPPRLAAVVRNEAILKGLAWFAGLRDDKEAARALGVLAAGSYKMAPAVGNAAIYSLGAMPGREGLAQLAVLAVKLRDKSAKIAVAKALAAAALRLGLPADEVEELAVPDYGMGEVGRLSVPFGEFSAELTVGDDRSVEIAWVKPGGKPQKTVPAAVKSDHADALKELKATAKDVEAMASAQRIRLDNLFLARKTWPLDAWRVRYLDHPIVGLIARKLIWRFTTGADSVAGIFSDGELVGLDDKPLVETENGVRNRFSNQETVPDTVVREAETIVELWHPIGHAVDDVLAWRSWLEAHRVRQPFKQAHREVYLLTDAEQATRVYSNRFAAHVIRQHQFNALCGVRGWKNSLRLMVDAEYPPASLSLPRWGLRAEFWVEGIGDNYGADTNETGTYLRLATDQVRFYPLAAAQRSAHASGGGYAAPLGRDDEPVPLDQIPPLVLSEVLRDVDLFVGVASVGNDPNWSDGGPDGRFVDYWQTYSFGDLTATAQTRKAVLQKVVPRLKIADRCTFGDKFLIVRGELRTYKIHLGSGNILMEPNDQYLCIVPKREAAAKGGDKVFLPFEGDGTLSVVLSKALLLAEDDKITDATIVSQIRR